MAIVNSLCQMNGVAQTATIETTKHLQFLRLVAKQCFLNVSILILVTACYARLLKSISIKLE